MSTNLLRFVLREAGHEVVLAETGQAAHDVVVGQETAAVVLEWPSKTRMAWKCARGYGEVTTLARSSW